MRSAERAPSVQAFIDFEDEFGAKRKKSDFDASDDLCEEDTSIATP